MTEAVVLDASAAIALMHRESAGERVLAVLAERVQTGLDLIVPPHFWLEISNVLIGRYGYTTQQLLTGVHLLDEFAPRTIEMDRPTWLLTMDRMRRNHLTAYDAAYLALADSMKAWLLTLDRDLARAAGSGALGVSPRRLQEEPVPYGAGDPNQVWAEFGGYLAELRRTTASD